ncbi:error-prone DNA polymerase [Polyangium aurulentum]|uniref:error-prone DNA polymerase n=1 Tax=Polyangium aurulentum TaxID=2567896 RepID=UPI0010AE9FB5|nr:error-prone DNA polymerase [Polyangium aurulentum]UQA63850.1 error-prone DNA polymerase [Polyangium aurulentum]
MKGSGRAGLTVVSSEPKKPSQPPPPPDDPPAFAELCARSCFSFLEGASHPQELVRRSSELGQSAIAVADRDGLYGVVRAHTEAKNVGQRLIVGAELTLEPAVGDLEEELEDVAARPHGSVVLLVEDHAGYSNLCRLLTLAHAAHEKGRAAIPIEAIAASAEGLTAIVPLAGPALVRDTIFGPLVAAFGKERAFIATWRHLDRSDAARHDAAIEASTRYGLDVLASGRPLFHHGSRKPLADVLLCIRRKTTLDQAGAWLAPNAEAALRSPASMKNLFKDHPDWVRRTVDVADRCRFSLDEIRYRFPSETSCLPDETPDDALRRLTYEGCRDRYPEGTPPAVAAQIEKELDLIRLLDVAPYFLSVQQIVNMARARRILCQGRGSAANSAVCFVLGVTAVDPARSSLLFERFLSAERHEPPDIDVDFEHERREEVIQEIYETYGRDRSAMVSEVISYRGKSSLREVGKVFGLSLDQLDRLSGLVMYHEANVNERKLEELGFDPKDVRLRQIVLLASALEGFPRHLSIHVGGFVLSADALHRVAPIEPARMPGRTVIPWDKDDLDDLGFFKVDILALGMLTAIRKTLALVHERENPGEPFDPIDALARIPPEDPAVYEAISRADTVGVFQIESRAQMSMLPRLKPNRFYDLVIEVAIVRPGPIQGGMVHPYLRRRTGEEPVTSPHPCLDPILERTLGVPLFQEQVMQIAMVGAGYSPGEADQLRRDMAAWKKNNRLVRHRERLLRGFAERGISSRFGEQLYQQIHGFAEYGFPESHAASFALLVYASAWLKVRHPAPFVCALLNSQPMGFYSPSSLIQDAVRHGVEARPVCVIASDWDYYLEPDGALRLGMRQIKGFGQAAAEAVIAARQEGPFAGVSDLVRRAGLKKNEVEALAEAGALEALVPSRREALWRARAPKLEGLFEEVALEEEKDIGLPKMRPAEQLVLDYGRLGLSLTDHPLRHFRERLEAQGAITTAALKDRRHGETVRIAGLVVGRQRPATASGVTFVTVEDETGVANVVVRKQLFEQSYAAARYAKILLVVGRLEKKGGVVHVVAEELERLDVPGKRGLNTRSRDFH